ncbi:MAG: hypothetical protein IJS15_11515, partial [Victivallales bacterium]|nr:hypothetical protein [Victivallales bacterium]
HGHSTVVEGNSTVYDGNSTGHDGNSTVGDGNSTVKRDASTVRDGNSTVKRDASTVRDGNSTVKHGNNAVDVFSSPVKRVLEVLNEINEGSMSVLQKRLGIKYKGDFHQRYIRPAMQLGVIELTQPDSPHSPTQKYRLTEKGRNYLSHLP